VPDNGDYASCSGHFDENNEEDCRHFFWDWYTIGGRWSGAHLEAKLDPVKLEAFRDWLTAENVTVSGLRFGKEELSPADQIPKVDEKWVQMFPATTDKCPLFQHSGKSIDGDVQLLGDVSPALKCSHLIIAGPSYNDGKHDGPPEAVYMVSDSIWNGVTHVDTKWDTLVSSAITAHKERISGYKPEYAARTTPQPDWLVVTVDYHS